MLQTSATQTDNLRKTNSTSVTPSLLGKGHTTES